MMPNKTNQLKSKLKELFENACLVLKEEASKEFSASVERREMIDRQKEVVEVLTELIRENLKGVNSYCEPSEDFYQKIEKILPYRFFYTYPDYTLDEKISDEALVAAESSILAGRLSELDHFRKNAKGILFECDMDESYYRQKQLINNLGYYFYMQAHLAKRFGAREAAIDFLRSVSIIEGVKQDMLLRFKEGQVDELVRNAQEGMDAIKVAADYASLSDWETFRTAELEKFNLAVKQNSEAETKNGNA